MIIRALCYSFHISSILCYFMLLLHQILPTVTSKITGMTCKACMSCIYTSNREHFTAKSVNVLQKDLPPNQFNNQNVFILSLTTLPWLQRHLYVLAFAVPAAGGTMLI